jgi:hypothetical protein
MGCKDGNAIFNYRIKFPIKLPCTFPRLYFAVYDFNVFGTDDCIGHCYISLKRVFKRLLQEGRLIVDKKWLPLTAVEDPGEQRGEIEYSIHVIQKYEADQDPVGEAWDEPNKNPKLKKPQVGRGLADFFSGIDLKFNFDLFGNLKLIILLGFLFFIFLVLFVKPGLLIHL